MLKGNAQATQEVVPIEEIRDGVVILKNHSLRMVLMISSLNFALKSADEQAAILAQFQNFLNALDFHVQIFIESRRLDIRPYLNTLEERMAAQTNDLLKIQTREYIGFIRQFTETTEIMTKSFFVVVPYTPTVLTVGKSKGLLGGLFKRSNSSPQASPSTLQTNTNFDEDRMQLEQRAAVVEQGFRGLGLRVAPLGTEELVELYGKLFNPGQNDVPSLTNA